MRNLALTVCLISGVRAFALTPPPQHALTARGGVAMRAAAAAVPVPEPVDSSDVAKVATSLSGGETGGSTISQSSFNLVKNIVGCGVLSLPAGVAALSDKRAALLPALGLLAFIATLSGYCFSLLGQACYATGTTTYGDAWEKSVGPKSAWIPKFVCTTKTGIACLAYSMIIADSFSSIFTAVGAPAALCSRNAALQLITATVITPLCLLRSFAALAPFSMFGVGGMVYTTGFMGVRWWQGAYKPGGKFYGAIAKSLTPVFNAGGGKPINAFILLSMVSTAFIAHYNAPKFYVELKDRSSSRFNKLTSVSFGTSLAFFALVTAFGFGTFGGASQGLILNNYALTDAGATLARVAVGFSVLTGYPLTFVGFRDGVLELFGSKTPSRKTLDVASLGLVGAIMLAAMKITDLGFLLAFAGAFFGSGIAYILPAMIALGAAEKGLMPSTPSSRNTNRGVIATGYVLMSVGTVVSILKYFTKVLG